jgi:hypothetical protein
MLRDMKAAFGQDDLRMRLRRQKSSAVEDITAEWPAEFDRRTALLEAAMANWEAELADRPQCPAWRNCSQKVVRDRDLYASAVLSQTPPTWLGVSSAGCLR